MIAALLIAISGCQAVPLLEAQTDQLRVITTTPLLADLVKQVGGEHVQVVSIVPAGGDPHSYEPTLRDARNAVYADVAFSNYALLEEHNVIKTLDANLDEDAVNVSLAEESIKYAAELIPLVENVNLDTVWLGMRSQGLGEEYGADRSSEVLVSAVAADGPGDVHAYLTGTFGETDIYFSSADGFDAASGYDDDTMTLPLNAHTHLSWAFTKPGIYTLTLRSRLQVSDTERPTTIDEQTFTFAVGVDPAETDLPGAVVIDEGHADISTNLDTGRLEILHDPEGGGESTQQFYAADEAIIEVPSRALDEIPGGEEFRFLGQPGDQIYQLAQAVLGKHVHGEIDPHLWQNARNGMAYVELIRDTLIEADPDHARDYVAQADAYLAELEQTDAYVRETTAQIPASHRYLVTTHDAFGYLADAYDFEVAGFVTPNPAAEPSLADRRKLAETISNLKVPAVFLEPNLATRSSTLTELAADAGIAVCDIYGDAFDDRVTTYIELLRFNADSLLECLG